MLETLDPDFLPTNDYGRGLSASLVIPGHIVVYGFTAFSTNAGSQFVLMFDASAVPADTAVPILALDVAAATLRGVSWSPPGRQFLQGFVLCTSSTAATKTIGSADTFFDVQYDVLGG